MHCPKCGSTEIKREREDSIRYWYRSGSAYFVQLLRSLVRNAYEKRYGLNYACLQCGYTWRPKMEAIYARRRNHISELLDIQKTVRFSGVNGSYLELTGTMVKIYKTPKKWYGLFFDEIAAVDYRTGDDKQLGRLSIQIRSQKGKPFPPDDKTAQKDKYTIYVEKAYQGIFALVYQALDAIAQDNRKEDLLY